MRNNIDKKISYESEKPSMLKEIKESLKRNEGFEMRGFGTLRTKIQKPSIRRNPKTNQKISVKKKIVIKWKMSQDLFKKLNNDKK